MSESILLDVADGVATLTFNRPDIRNALGEGVKEEFAERLVQVERDRDVRCVVIRGAGASFMAGGDVKYFATLREVDPEERRRIFLARVHALTPILFALRRMPKPVIASVHHAAAGFGCVLTAACDFAIASDDAFFVMSYIHLGLNPDGGGSMIMPRVLGVRAALEMAMLGERWDAERARQAGLVNFVVPRAALIEETTKLARRLAAGPTQAYAATKRLMYVASGPDLGAQLLAEAESLSHCAMTDDFNEGVAAFHERRAPVFQGR